MLDVAPFEAFDSGLVNQTLLLIHDLSAFRSRSLVVSIGHGKVVAEHHAEIVHCNWLSLRVLLVKRHLNDLIIIMNVAFFGRQEESLESFANFLQGNLELEKLMPKLNLWYYLQHCLQLP